MPLKPLVEAGVQIHRPSVNESGVLVFGGHLKQPCGNRRARTSQKDRWHGQETELDVLSSWRRQGGNALHVVRWRQEPLTLHKSGDVSRGSRAVW